jgi:hypothetical protein
MARSALCVGINEFKSLPMSSWLSGCVNDAHDISAALRKYGFTARNTTVLTDADATKPAVMTALERMIGKARAGDHLVFSFSSHGTQVPNHRDDDAEPDGLDEAFACYEIRSAGDRWDPDTVIIDDELRDLFGRVPAGVLVEVLLDTCHSGTGLKRLEDLQLDLMRGRRPRFLPPPTPKGLRQARSIREVSPPKTVDRKPLVDLISSRTTAAKPVLFAACKSGQTASDATFDARSNGAFTYLFLKALKAAPTSSRADLLKAVTSGLKAEDFDQRSTLEAPVKAKRAAFGESW